ncbi:hypothetical protein RRF57_012823 [Xylaria bambusicola]|uniref:DUF6923 domain-containing protein n=1 Tax=Xylaria bambusicola TaxID=326684 RepID=A0AAN7UQE9_9PEZI
MKNRATMTPTLNFLAFLALSSVKVLANPTAALLGDLLDIVSLDVAPLITEVVTTTYPASTPTTYTTSTYDTSCQCHYSTIFWWTPHPHHSYEPHPYQRRRLPHQYGYLIQAVTLYQVDLSTGGVSVVKDHLGDDTTINAMAYNTLDNFLYARQRGNNELIRISSDGTTEVVTTFPDNNNNVNIGDIDTDGNYWYAGMDLKPGSATYGTLIDSGKVDNLGLSIADWAYLPVGGPYLYSAAHNTTAGGGTTLIRFSLETKTYGVVQRYPNIGGHTWGAMYAINNGTLYASDNTNGEIWAFPIEGGSRPYLASQGPISGQNDGARCVLNLDV